MKEFRCRRDRVTIVGFIKYILEQFHTIIDYLKDLTILMLLQKYVRTVP